MIAFIKLTATDDSVTELWVDALAVRHIGVVDGATFVETSAGCSYVTETPREVFDKLTEVAAHYDD